MIFQSTPTGNYSRVYNFDGTDGSQPYFYSLLLGNDGNLYGTTTSGGATSTNCPDGCGVIYGYGLN